MSAKPATDHDHYVPALSRHQEELDQLRDHQQGQAIQLATLSTRFEERFDRVDERIDHVSEKVDQISKNVSKGVWLVLAAVILAVVKLVLLK